MYFFYSFILSQEGNKYLLCTKFHSCDLRCRSGFKHEANLPKLKNVDVRIGGLFSQATQSPVFSYVLSLWYSSDNVDSKSP